MIRRSGLLLILALPLAAIGAGAGGQDCGGGSKVCPAADDAVLSTTAVEVLGPAPAPAGGAQIPCSDPNGCPDLVVDQQRLMQTVIQVQSFSASSCSVQEGHTQPGIRRLLRFTFTTPNFGSGDLVVGRPADHPEWFVWAPCHKHYHFRQYADYRLWTPAGYLLWTLHRTLDPDTPSDELLAAHPELQALFIAGNKQGFCVIDLKNYWPGYPAKYLSCGANQGIARGWADEYHYSLDGQWIDITGVAAGSYVLEAEVNSERLYLETDYLNNASAINVRI